MIVISLPRPPQGATWDSSSSVASCGKGWPLSMPGCPKVGSCLYGLNWKIRPHRRWLGRDLPDGTRKRLQVYLGGGWQFFGQNLLFLIVVTLAFKKHCKKGVLKTPVRERAPSKIGKRKVKKTRVFQTFWPQFFGLQHLFLRFRRWPGPEADFWVFGPVSDWFSSFCDSRNTGFYSVFLFSACLTASFKTSKNIVNYTVLCYGVNENIVNTSVFWRWIKKHCKLQCFWPPDPQKPMVFAVVSASPRAKTL